MLGVLLEVFCFSHLIFHLSVSLLGFLERACHDREMGAAQINIMKDTDGLLQSKYNIMVLIIMFIFIIIIINHRFLEWACLERAGGAGQIIIAAAAAAAASAICLMIKLITIITILKSIDSWNGLALKRPGELGRTWGVWKSRSW